MARPRKKGLKYFPLDSDFFFADGDIKGLIARFGAAGIALYLYTLCEIYREDGYYLALNDDFEYLAAKDVGVPRETVFEVMAYLYGRGLLIKRKTETAGTVITSAGIQKRYQLAITERARRRGAEVDPGIWVLPKSETASFIRFTGGGDMPEPEETGDDESPFTDPAVEAAFQAYLEERGEIKPAQVAALRGKLRELSTDPGEQAGIIKEATIHGWKSFYPPKKETDKPRKGGKKKPAFYGGEQRERDYKALEAELVSRTAEETKGGNDDN